MILILVQPRIQQLVPVHVPKIRDLKKNPVLNDRRSRSIILNFKSYILDDEFWAKISWIGVGMGDLFMSEHWSYGRTPTSSRICSISCEILLKSFIISISGRASTLHLGHFLK